MMYAVFGRQLRYLAIIDIDVVYMAMLWVVFVALEDDALLFGVETKNILNNPRSTCQLL